MSASNLQDVTIIYIDGETMELEHTYGAFPVVDNGRVMLNDEFKLGKSIVAVCQGIHKPLDIQNCNQDII
ncbi:DUF2375 family protein [Thalassotalea maritima]|uniref:DUF2375 family protein n=1 Tax=Thalassotalea maritima TaxID=3242416 RepID=UPI0035285B0E